MNAEIISVGSELLLGQIVNTNAQFLSRHLAEMGVNVFYQTVVGDNSDRLLSTIQKAEERADLIIFTGGLGPTRDDLTKETIAAHLGKKLVLNDEAFKGIRQYFLKIGREMTENNKKQALVLEDCLVLPNENGMAPGMFVKSKNKFYMLLPGPPKEMQPMFEKYGRPAILNVLDRQESIVSRVLRFFGIGESQLETEIEDMIMNQTNPTIAPLAGDGEVTIRLTAKHRSKETANEMIDKVEKEILNRVGEYFYGYGQTTIAAELVQKLKQQNKTIACAESLTGGLFQSMITAVAGASAVLKGGIVCYTNEAKEHLVDVSKKTLDTFGAVSEQCAKELAENVRKKLNADIGISFTGVAGPDSLEENPPGTVWIGISEKGKESKAVLLKLAGDRNQIRNRTAKYGCHFLLRTCQ
ncbi:MULTISPECIES: competence/damage-inducible protein A [Bacillus]|uniref:competence/damage-inducible protein A n=1 Tax=Bacillus TaxID=1386 RepID=UPI00065DD874|nr:competence/damage-inducible protein A [Bacillus smithii]AKP47300.1 Molybdopterin binding motifCinA N-terminal domain C-terminal domain of CinA type S [Bacillus smithii]MED1421618.1 competence/damage-inducible protein A [Bacillus smithii]MED1457831.1 competence/damage-inducible protein A [Bacillus smithii]MED1490047.1 competence/damage-inducible protein A [Bacillus smithii]MED4884265.1 competence/damage-inducible protein A [Bacillus smithii]